MGFGNVTSYTGGLCVHCSINWAISIGLEMNAYVRARRTPEEMKWKLSVQFQGEEGIDAGGVTREWYQVRLFFLFALAYLKVG